MNDQFQPAPELPPVKVVQRKRQRTIRLRVDENQVIVSGPASVSRSRLLNFAREKKEWIQKTFNRRRQRKKKLDQQREILKGTVLLRGERKNIYDFPVPGLRKPRLVEHDKAVVHQFDPVVQDAAGHTPNFPENDLIHSFYRNLAQNELRSRFIFWSGRLPFNPAKLTIRNQKTKWGSCSARGAISLNWRLVKCPLWITDYIIIHELCHLKHLNHSPAFWYTVASYYPHIKEAKAWIREHSDVIFGDF